MGICWNIRKMADHPGAAFRVSDLCAVREGEHVGVSERRKAVHDMLVKEFGGMELSPENLDELIRAGRHALLVEGGRIIDILMSEADLAVIGLLDSIGDDDAVKDGSVESLVKGGAPLVALFPRAERLAKEDHNGDSSR